VDVSFADKARFFHAPAVKLSDADLNDMDGLDGVPLKYEHKGEPVGSVAHSWVDSEQGRCLKIWGRIPLQDAGGRPIARGHQMVADIRAGKIKGLSVGYRTPLRYDAATGTTKVASKMFDEVSLVEEPFFEGCDLTVGVLASANSAATGNLGNKLGLLDN